MGFLEGRWKAGFNEAASGFADVIRKMVLLESGNDDLIRPNFLHHNIIS